jgi:hypothetical protein
MLPPATSRARTVQNWLRRLLRRPGKPQVVHAGAAAAIGVAGSVTARSAGDHHPIRLPTSPRTPAVVTQRINELHQKVQQQRDDLAAETEARKTAIRDAQAVLTGEIDQVCALSRQVAVGGLRLQAVSWAFLFVGRVGNAVG